MTIVRSLITDLREKRLWPVAAALLVALIAVPLLLSKSSTPAAVAPPPVLPGATGPAPALPAVSVTTTPSNARLAGPERNPFNQQVKASSATGASTGTGSTSQTSGSGSTSSGASAGSGGSSSSSSSTGSSSTGSSSTGASTGSTGTSTSSTTAQPPAPWLTPTQSYSVSISITTSGGGVNTLDPVQRLAVLPGTQHPQLIELGVEKGSDRVLFVVQPGTVLGGPGACTPGPIDCQIVSLRPNQIESISRKTSSGVVAVAQMAVTGVNIDTLSSAAAARKARGSESAAGRRLLSQSTLSAVSLFHYDPSAGAVLDMRNLTVGGN